MATGCMNLYCDDPNPEMRSPTPEELIMWLASLSGEVDEVRDLLGTGQVRLMICLACNSWTAETRDKEKRKTVRFVISSPFRFVPGERLRVILEGKRHGMVGTVALRTRLVRTIYPAPSPENYYWLTFEGSQNEEGFREEHLEPAD